ncbi:MAG: Lrp/AsnC ligand binding domain-containing protein [Candidatus Altiarchaeota archaeon]|nr:Lrp/AsnC ligand binding domain-containing protein [Candidatus Altiarchaeota archaeon]
MKAYVLIKTGEGEAKNALREVRAINGVVEADGVYGSMDLVAKLECDNLADLVVDEIRKIKGVKDTNTLIVAL